MHKQTTPTTIIAMILGLFHPFEACAASVSGTNIKVTAAESSVSPPTSRSYQVRRTMLIRLLFRFGRDEGLIRFSLRAFRWFRSKESASGRKAAGRMIAHMPYPHRQEEVRSTAPAMVGPSQTVTRNGNSGRRARKARFNKSLLSAMNTCWRICKPVEPAE